MQVIQWYPGHMAKTKREVLEKMKMIDLVIELKDARIPHSSTNPLIDEIIGSKPRLILLCKSSMADENITQQWMTYYEQKGCLVLDIDSITGYHIKDVYSYARVAMKETFQKREAKQIKSRAIKAMILGIPNVGKSTLINTLAQRKATNVGDKPGVTKSQTWIKIKEDFYILDTPGILWPKFEDQEVGLKLALCGSIKEEILNLDDLAYQAISMLAKNYPSLLKERYQIELDDDPVLMLEQIGKKRGFLSKGGIVDLERVNRVFLMELRGKKIGRVSYEKPSL